MPSSKVTTKSARVTGINGFHGFRNDKNSMRTASDIAVCAGSIRVKEGRGRNRVAFASVRQEIEADGRKRVIILVCSINGRTQSHKMLSQPYDARCNVMPAVYARQMTADIVISEMPFTSRSGGGNNTAVQYEVKLKQRASTVS